MIEWVILFPPADCALVRAAELFIEQHKSYTYFCTHNRSKQ
jgi:hypothetical protein